MEALRFPRTLYKTAEKGEGTAWNTEHWYHDLIVKDDTEMKKAENKGWLDSFEKAIFGLPKTASRTATQKPKVKSEDDY